MTQNENPAGKVAMTKGVCGSYDSERRQEVVTFEKEAPFPAKRPSARDSPRPRR